MLKEFKPKGEVPLDKSQIRELFRMGDFHNAPQQCKKANYPLTDFQADIDIGIRKLSLAHRANEVLSFIYKYSVPTKHNIKDLLLMVFGSGDYHSFLKDACRFEMYEGFEEKINFAINILYEKGQAHDASGWQRKFQEMKAKNK